MNRSAILSSILAACPTLAAQDVHRAAQAGDLAAVRALVTARPDRLRAEDELHRLALHLAARYGHREVVELLVDRGAEIDHAAYNDFTALMLAASFGRQQVVEYLVDKGAKLSPRSSFGRTALDQAADRGHRGIVTFLAGKGAVYSLDAAVALDDLPGCKAAVAKDPKAARNWKHIWSAARRGHAKIAKFLLDHGAPTQAEGAMVGTVPLLVPALAHDAVVKALLDAGAEVDPLIHNYKGVADGSTPLLLAATLGHTRSAEVLLAYKADPTAVDGRSWNALHCAASGGHVELVRRFLKLGVDPKKRAGEDWTPMMLAAMRMNPSKSNAKENSRLRQVIDEFTTRGLAPDLYTAVCIGHGQRVREILLRKPQPVRRPDRNLDVVLVKAVEFGHVQIADLLCASGASVKQMDESGYTPLHWAAFWNRQRAAKVLLDHGADPNAVGKTGFTPLHEAARLGSPKVAELLILAGAEVDVKDESGKRPIDYVTTHGDAAAVRALLKKHGGK